MTNLEKMKKQLIDTIKGMDAQTFEDNFGESDHEYFSTCRLQHDETCPHEDEPFPDCQKCCVEWLNTEAHDE